MTASGLRWMNTVSFSVLLGYQVVTEESSKSPATFLGMLDLPITRFLDLFFRNSLEHMAHQALFELHLNLLWLLCAAVTILIWSVIQRIRKLDSATRMLEGWIIVTGFPVIWLRLFTVLGLSRLAAAVLTLEVIAVGIVISIWFIEMRQSIRTCSIILSLHFLLWAGVTWHALLSPLAWLYPTLSLFAALSWVSYVTSSRSPTERAAGSIRGHVK